MKHRAKLLAFVFVLSVSAEAEDTAFRSLFPSAGVPEGWLVRSWANVGELPDAPVQWTVSEGVLTGGDPRGTWLVSEREYGDFILEFEWRLEERGNGGVGLRFPLWGDPAFAGMEIQMLDPRYHGDETVPDTEQTGAIYKLVAPTVQAFVPLDWNRYQITCAGPRIKIILNGQLIHDLNMEENAGEGAKRVLSERPRKGRIGFQELSRGTGHVRIRGARIRELSP